MALPVQRRSNENPDQLLVRFNKSVNQTMRYLRRNKAFQRNESRLKIKVKAIKSATYRAARAARKFYD